MENVGIVADWDKKKQLGNNQSNKHLFIHGYARIRDKRNNRSQASKYGKERYVRYVINCQIATAGWPLDEQAIKKQGSPVVYRDSGKEQKRTEKYAALPPCGGFTDGEIKHTEKKPKSKHNTFCLKKDNYSSEKKTARKIKNYPPFFYRPHELP